MAAPDKHQLVKRTLAAGTLFLTIAGSYWVIATYSSFTEPSILTLRDLTCQFWCKNRRWPKEKSEVLSMANTVELAIIDGSTQRESMEVEFDSRLQKSVVLVVTGKSWGLPWSREYLYDTGKCDCGTL